VVRFEVKPELPRQQPAGSNIYSISTIHLVLDLFVCRAGRPSVSSLYPSDFKGLSQPLSVSTVYVHLDPRRYRSSLAYHCGDHGRRRCPLLSCPMRTTLQVVGIIHHSLPFHCSQPNPAAVGSRKIKPDKSRRRRIGHLDARGSPASCKIGGSAEKCNAAAAAAVGVRCEVSPTAGHNGGSLFVTGPTKHAPRRPSMPLPTPDTNVEYLEFSRCAPCLVAGGWPTLAVRHRGVQRVGSMPLGGSKLRPRTRSTSRILRASPVFLRLRLSATYFGVNPRSWDCYLE
jgi:hypothetical protein